MKENLNNETKELNDQFSHFLKTKGIKAKFKLAFTNIKESANLQHQQDTKEFNEVKEKSLEDNKEFVEFLKTKGLKAKINLVIENVKNDAKQSNQRVKEQIEASKYNPTSVEKLNQEFNEFLKVKGLSSKYTVVIEEIK